MTISKPRIQEIENAKIMIAMTTKALHNSLINLASSSITRSGSVYKRLINSPTPISSKALAGKLFFYIDLY